MRTISLFLLLFAFSYQVNAQSVNSEIEGSSSTFLSKFEKRELIRAQKLHLSLEQLKTLDDMNDTYVTRFAAIHEDKSISKKDKKETIKKFQQERYNKFVDMLQPDQKIIWDSLKLKKQKKFFRKK